MPSSSSHRTTTRRGAGKKRVISNNKKPKKATAAVTASTTRQTTTPQQASSTFICKQLFLLSVCILMAIHGIIEIYNDLSSSLQPLPDYSESSSLSSSSSSCTSPTSSSSGGAATAVKYTLNEPQNLSQAFPRSWEDATTTSAATTVGRRDNNNVSEEEEEEAICEFHNYKMTRHFPHAMQLLYACWSYWQTTQTQMIAASSGTNGGAVRLVLVHDMTIWEAIVFWYEQGYSSFLPGMKRTLQDVFGIEIRSQIRLWKSTPRGSSSHSSYYPNSFVPQLKHRGQTFFVDDPAYMEKLRSGIVQYYNLVDQDDGLTTTSVASTTSATCQSNSSSPRIGILNRLHTRSILNVPEIVRMIQQQQSSAMNVSTTAITVTCFEKASFLEQVQFFANHDIVISPHGAQLTGIPFMPTTPHHHCSSVLEFFPKGYFVPDYFGSLSYVSNISHRYMYLGNSEKIADEVRVGMQDYQHRAKARSQNLCVPINKLKDAVFDMIQEWKECCKT